MSYEDDVKKYYTTMERYKLYDNNTQAFLKSIDKNYAYKQRIISFLKKHPSSLVFDAGFGTGRNMVIFSKYSKEVHGIDFTPDRVIEFKKKIKELQLKKIFPALGDVRHIQYDDEFFDAVYSYSVLINISQKEQFQAMREMYRILKPGGIGVFNTINSLSLIGRLWYSCTVNCPQYFVSYSKVKRELEQIGFEVEEVLSYNLIPNFFGMKDTLHKNRFLKIFGYNLYYVCRKRATKKRSSAKN